MPKKKLDAYKGRLTPAQAAEGIKAAIENARRLTEDARTLFAADRFPSAASLAILAIEEAGKVSIIRAVASTRNEAEAGKEWRDYRSHTRKNVTWTLPELVSRGARTLDDMEPLFAEDAEHPYILDHIKQLGFYTDCLGNANWARPTAVISKEIADQMIHIAELFSNEKKEASELEIGLWVKHMQPVWNTVRMTQALLDWHHDMVAHGLADDDGSMEQFVFGGEGKGEKP